MIENIYSDDKIIKGIAENSSEAINWVYNHIQPMIIKWIIAKGGQYEIAEDVFQEGMLVLFHQCQKEDFILTSKLSTYLLAICKRLWYKNLQQNKNIHLEEDISMYEFHDIDIGIKEKEEEEIAFNQINKALEQLGSPCKDLIKAFYLEEKNMIEIAELFNYSNANTAKTQRYKCMNRLRNIMKLNSRS